MWAKNIGGDLEKYVKSEPSWDDIEKHSKVIASEYFVTKEVGGNQRQNKDMDQQKNNQILFNQDAMYYQILVHAMNNGMVDIVADSLSFWVPIFRGCGKFKYASYLTNFLYKLKHYPEPLRQAVLKCWLCNPLGKAISKP